VACATNTGPHGSIIVRDKASSPVAVLAHLLVIALKGANPRVQSTQVRTLRNAFILMQNARAVRCVYGYVHTKVIIRCACVCQHKLHTAYTCAGPLYKCFSLRCWISSALLPPRTCTLQGARDVIL
jgi:hypothetical protein